MFISGHRFCVSSISVQVFHLKKSHVYYVNEPASNAGVADTVWFEFMSINQSAGAPLHQLLVLKCVHNWHRLTLVTSLRLADAFMRQLKSLNIGFPFSLNLVSSDTSQTKYVWLVQSCISHVGKLASSDTSYTRYIWLVQSCTNRVGSNHSQPGFGWLIILEIDMIWDDTYNRVQVIQSLLASQQFVTYGYSLLLFRLGDTYNSNVNILVSHSWVVGFVVTSVSSHYWQSKF